MGLPRSQYVQEGQEGVYHCFCRCVRRAFLCGFDPLTGRDFSHRKELLLDRLRHLAAIFAIEVCAYALMENHYHLILRTRPDMVQLWSDWEVATRWLTLFPRRYGLPGAKSPREQDIRALVDCPERIAQLRKRLSSLSWFMAQINEFVARAANKEDGVKGRFWDGRFKCQALLDEAAIAAGMAYVDLNPVRAGQAASPEESDFTSIQERIRAWQQEKLAAAAFPHDAPIPGSAPRRASWLCPIESHSGRRGILQMKTAEYFNLVDLSGRITRPDKRGAIDAGLAPILLRIRAKPESWAETVSSFGSRFRLAAGLVSSLRRYADSLGRKWFKGLAAARAAFASEPAQPA